MSVTEFLQMAPEPPAAEAIQSSLAFLEVGHASILESICHLISRRYRIQIVRTLIYVVSLTWFYQFTWFP